MSVVSSGRVPHRQSEKPQCGQSGPRGRVGSGAFEKAAIDSGVRTRARFASSTKRTRLTLVIGSDGLSGVFSRFRARSRVRCVLGIFGSSAHEPADFAVDDEDGSLVHSGSPTPCTRYRCIRAA